MGGTKSKTPRGDVGPTDGTQSASCHTSIIPPSGEVSSILALADDVLDRATLHKETWLASGDDDDLRLWQALVSDRELVLEAILLKAGGGGR